MVLTKYEFKCQKLTNLYLIHHLLKNSKHLREMFL